jgi:hypothetical protein
MDSFVAELTRSYREYRPEWAGYHATHRKGTIVRVMDLNVPDQLVLVSFGGADPLPTEQHWLQADMVKRSEA